MTLRNVITEGHPEASQQPRSVETLGGGKIFFRAGSCGRYGTNCYAVVARTKGECRDASHGSNGNRVNYLHIFSFSMIFFFSGVKLGEFQSCSFIANIDNSEYSAFSPTKFQQQDVQRVF